MREIAKHLLVHYFKLIGTRAGLQWGPDLTAEVESIVDAIVDAAVAEAVAQAEEIAESKGAKVV